MIAGASAATDRFYQALEAAKKGEFDKCERLMSEGDEILAETHEKQTDLLRNEMKGTNLPFSLLLVHAQDHLMQVMLFKRIINELIDIYKHQGGK